VIFKKKTIGMDETAQPQPKHTTYCLTNWSGYDEICIRQL